MRFRRFHIQRVHPLSGRPVNAHRSFRFPRASNRHFNLLLIEMVRPCFRGLQKPVCNPGLHSGTPLVVSTALSVANVNPYSNILLVSVPLRCVHFCLKTRRPKLSWLKSWQAQSINVDAEESIASSNVDRTPSTLPGRDLLPSHHYWWEGALIRASPPMIARLVGYLAWSGVALNACKMCWSQFFQR